MKQKRFIGILLVLVLVMGSVPVVYAYMFRKSQTVANSFVPARVTCEAHEEFDHEKKSHITVENTGNVDAYIRVRLVFHWEDSKGNIVARNMDLSAVDGKAFVDYDSEHWVRESDIGETGTNANIYTYYCKDPVAVGEETPDLLNTPIVMSAVKVPEKISETEVVYYYYYPVIEVLAEAIQSKPVEAVASAWGVTVVDGQIQ